MVSETENISTQAGTQATAAAPVGVSSAEDKAPVAVNGNNVRASWKYSLDNIRANIAYMSPESRELLIWAFTWCIDPVHSVWFDDFAGRIGVSPNTCYKFYSGKYKHPVSGAKLDLSEKVRKAIQDFRRNELGRSRLGAKRFIKTPTAERVFWACDQARKSNTPVMVYGGSQIGKTEAFRRYCVENNHGKSILIELEAVNGLQGLLKAIAEKVGVSPNANTSDIIARLKKALTPDMVLILDEVHLLANVYRRGSFFACMEQIRRIYDATKVGLVLSYTELGYAQSEKERKRELVQIFRRGVHKVNLGALPTVPDVRAIVDGFGLTWSDRHDEVRIKGGITDTPWAVLKQIAADEGLTAIIERIRLATNRAADHERDIPSWEDFVTAHYAILRNAQVPKNGWEERAA